MQHAEEETEDGHPELWLGLCGRRGDEAALLVQGAEGMRSASSASTAAFQMQCVEKLVQSWNDMTVSSPATREARGIGA